jgi:dihydrofolate reductase
MDMKLTVQTFLTLDGVMQAPGGPEEDPSDAFTHGGWQAPFADQAGDELQVWGSGELLQTLLRHGLVDRFRLMTFPLVLGSGRRLLNDGILPATMRPAGLTVTDLGIVIGTYEPAGPVRHGEM